MPISGLVITFAEDADDRTLAALRGVDGLELAAAQQRRAPATLETADLRQDRAARERIAAIDGVLHVDVAFIGFDAAPVSPAGA